MTTDTTIMTSEYGLRILAETPSDIAKRIARQRGEDEHASVDELAERVVGSLNQGQRWALAVAAVAAHVAAYDRAHARSIEKSSLLSWPARVERPRTQKVIDPAVVAEARREIGGVRALAEKAALDIVVTLTPELLNSPIRLGDGTEVLIGDATADQLAARLDLLERHAQGATDTLTRAVALLNLLRQSGRETLRQVAS